jgi:hypothetical protein
MIVVDALVIISTSTITHTHTHTPSNTIKHHQTISHTITITHYHTHTITHHHTPSHTHHHTHTITHTPSHTITHTHTPSAPVGKAVATCPLDGTGMSSSSSALTSPVAIFEDCTRRADSTSTGRGRHCSQKYLSGKYLGSRFMQTVCCQTCASNSRMRCRKLTHAGHARRSDHNRSCGRRRA